MEAIKNNVNGISYTYVSKGLRMKKKVAINDNKQKFKAPLTRFHNVGNTMNKYEANELEEVLKRSQEGKFSNPTSSIEEIREKLKNGTIGKDVECDKTEAFDWGNF